MSDWKEFLVNVNEAVFLVGRGNEKNSAHRRQMPLYSSSYCICLLKCNQIILKVLREKGVTLVFGCWASENIQGVSKTLIHWLSVPVGKRM